MHSEIFVVFLFQCFAGNVWCATGRCSNTGNTSDHVPYHWTLTRPQPPVPPARRCSSRPAWAWAIMAKWPTVCCRAPRNRTSPNKIWRCRMWLPTSKPYRIFVITYYQPGLSCQCLLLGVRYPGLSSTRYERHPAETGSHSRGHSRGIIRGHCSFEWDSTVVLGLLYQRDKYVRGCACAYAWENDRETDRHTRIYEREIASRTQIQTDRGHHIRPMILKHPGWSTYATRSQHANPSVMIEL